MEPTSIGGTATTSERLAEALARARAEFAEMPGLSLTREQAARLWALDVTVCDAALKALVESRFLAQNRRAAFVRVG